MINLSKFINRIKMFCLPCNNLNTTGSTITPINTLIIYCRVPGCKFPYNLNHTAQVHQCPICKEYGHGVRECKSSNRLEKIIKLKLKTENDIIPTEFQCTVINCPNKENHTIAGHRCKNCKKFGHGDNCCNICFNIGHTENKCIINTLEEILEKKYISVKLFNTIKEFLIYKYYSYFTITLKNNNKLYVKKYNEVISTCIMKAENIENNVNIYNQTHEKILKTFKQGLITNITNIWEEFLSDIYIKCPVCRTSNYNKDIHFIKGLETKEPCVICYESDPNVYFKQCNHVVICKNCCDKLEIFY